MGMIEEMLTDQENTIIKMCKHMRRLITLLSQYTDMTDEEKFLASIEKKQGITTESEDKQ